MLCRRCFCIKKLNVLLEDGIGRWDCKRGGWDVMRRWEIGCGWDVRVGMYCVEEG